MTGPGGDFPPQAAGAPAGTAAPGDPGAERILTLALGRLTDVEDRVEQIAGALDDLEAALRHAALQTTAESATGAAEDAAASEQPAPTLDMRVLVAWVGDHIAKLLERKLPQSGGWPHWCPAWWLHPEAIARFEALRRTWLEASAQPVGGALVVYFEHLDMQLATLCGDNGPFCGCVGGHAATSGAQFLGQLEPGEAYYREVEDPPGDDYDPPPARPAGTPPPPWAPPPAPADGRGGGYARAGPRGPSTPNGHAPAPPRW